MSLNEKENPKEKSDYSIKNKIENLLGLRILDKKKTTVNTESNLRPTSPNANKNPSEVEEIEGVFEENIRVEIN